MAEIEDDGQRLVLLRVGHQEVEQEALAAAGGAEHQRVPDVLDVEVEGVRRVMRRLEDGQGFAPEVRADALAAVQREQEAEVRGVRLEQRQAAQVLGAVAGHDAQPGVQQVVGLLEQAAVVHGERPSSLRPPGAATPRPSSPCRTSVSEHVPKKWPLTSSLGQGIAQLPDRGARGIVDEHLLRSGVRRDVVDERHALVEEVPAAGLQLAPHPVARDALPLEARDRALPGSCTTSRKRNANVWLGGSFMDRTLTRRWPTTR